MVKVDIFSGFLGAGKTTLIKKLINEAYEGEQVVLIENEFGEVGIDANLFDDSNIAVTEINSGCICCSLAGDFTAAFGNIVERFSPDRILIEPSGVGKLSDIASGVQSFDGDDVVINSMVTVVDAKKCRMYDKNFGEFFHNQIEYANAVILSHTAGVTDEKLNQCLEIVKRLNPEAVVITTDWDKLDGKQIIEAIECKDTLEAQLEALMEDHLKHEHEHHHHHHDHDEDEHEHHHHDDDCCSGHDHHHDHDEDEHEHHHHHDHDEDEHEHHHHDDDCCCGHDHHHDHDEDEHEHQHHHHDHDEDEHEHHHHDHDCCCGHDHHHHNHDADEVFTSWGIETPEKYSAQQLMDILEEIQDEKVYGMVIRAKGIVESKEGGFLHFEYVPGEPEVKEGGATVIGRICVIGAKINVEAIEKLFSIK